MGHVRILRTRAHSKESQWTYVEKAVKQHYVRWHYLLLMNESATHCVFETFQVCTGGYKVLMCGSIIYSWGKEHY